MSKQSKPKLNVLLAKTDQLSSSFKKGITEYIKFFKSAQGSFIGEKKTYSPKEGTIDEPSLRKNQLVVTTVDEKLEYLVNSSKEYIDSLFSQEATNASGQAKSELFVDGISLGVYSSLELLRLKSLIESGELEEMYANIPVRSDSEIWNETKADDYKNRTGIFETGVTSGVKKTTTKESYILSDPNIANVKDGKYTPQIASRDTVVELGDYTSQKYSGEYSQRQKAEILQRRTKLLVAVLEALKASNDVEAVDSQMNSNKLFGYLHTGKI